MKWGAILLLGAVAAAVAYERVSMSGFAGFGFSSSSVADRTPVGGLDVGIERADVPQGDQNSPFLSRPSPSAITAEVPMRPPIAPRDGAMGITGHSISIGDRLDADDVFAGEENTLARPVIESGEPLDADEQMASEVLPLADTPMDIGRDLDAADPSFWAFEEGDRPTGEVGAFADAESP